MTLTIAPLPVPLKEDEHGVVRVDGTRVTLDTVIGFFNQGESPEEIADGFPTLKLADIYAVIGYYLQHRSEVDEYLRQRKQVADEVRIGNESRFDPTGIRERLLAGRRTDGQPRNDPLRQSSVRTFQSSGKAFARRACSR